MDIKLNTNHLGMDLKQNHVNINITGCKSGGSSGTTDHSKLTNLDYEHSGHIGFASAAQIQELLDLLNNKQDTLTAGDNISIVDNIISATGLTKDEIYIGPDEPTDPNIKIWIDTNEVAQEFYTKEEIDAKNFATEAWVSAQGYLTQHQDLSEYAKKSEIPTKVSAFENDAGYLTEHQSLENYALKTELPTEYVKSATVQGNKLTLTNKDNTTVDFEPSGGGSGGGGTSYTFTNGLTETDGTVSWDLNDRIKAGEGNFSVKMGKNTISSGNYSLSFGYVDLPSNTTGDTWGIRSSGLGSLAFGSNSTRNLYGIIESNGEGSCTFGCIAGSRSSNYIKARGKGSFCHGYIAENAGYDMYASGYGSHAEGSGTAADTLFSHVEGTLNIKDTNGSTTSKGTYAHIVGNGTGILNRSNAYTLDWQGNGTFAGTVSSSTGADYAEYFEWKDGNPNNEDRVGYIVCLDGDKIVKANSGDDILGICSGTAMVLGDSAEWNWNKRYLTDDFGRIIYEDRMEHHEAIYNPDGELIEEAWDEEVHAPKENPDYNASRAYIKRSERPEWQIVGMMGKLYVRDDGSCVVNGYADVKDGIATKATSKTNMRVMERVTDNIVRVLMK